jgi:hypothetical protein
METDSFELGYLRAMINGLADQLQIAITAREWELVSMIAKEMKQAPLDAAAKAAAPKQVIRAEAAE